MRTSRTVALTLGALSGIAVVASCSLDLDESLIDKPRDGGVFEIDGTSLDGAPLDGATDGPLPPTSEAGACTADDQCKTTDGCVKGKCDLVRKTCAFEVCRAACSAGVCDQQKHTCGPGAPYKYKAAQFPLGQALLCGRCAAAVHPWLFVATPTGVVGFNVSNVGSGTPPPVPIFGLGFVPNEIVTSGSRVWMRGAPSGPAGAASRFPLAYIDPPLDPFATKIVARTVLTGYSRPAPEGFGMIARGPNDSALLLGPNLAPAKQATQYPATVVDVSLLNEPASLTAQVFTSSSESMGPFAMSGKRLLMQSLAGGVASFNFVDNAGAAGAAPGPTTNVTDLGNTASGSRGAAYSPDGAIFWITGQNQGVGGPTPTTLKVRGYFLVKNETDAIQANTGVDIEVYQQPPNPDAIGPDVQVVGALSMIDANTVMVTTAAREAPNALTAVQFVKRDPLGVIKDGATPRRQVLNAPIGRFAAATSSDGIGYLVANDIDGPPVSGTVYVFDPGCAP